LRHLRIGLAVFAFAAVASIGLASCGGDDNEGAGGGGGTLRATYASFPTLDPGLSYSAEGWTALFNSYLPLYTYASAVGGEGDDVIPALAEDMPEVSDDGKTYRISLRKGLEYSDGTPVKASDFPYTIERLFKLNSPGSPYFENVVGAAEFAETKRGGIPGIKANDKTGEIVIELEEPNSSFVNELGLLFAAPVPRGTPNEDLTADPPPSTGQYEIVSVKSGRGWEYTRNPAWKKANGEAMPDLPAGFVDAIEVDVVRNATTQVNEVERGRYHWMQNPPPADRIAQVKREFDGEQFRVDPTLSTYYFWMNTERAPFDDAKVRQAVNHAVNGKALERIYAGTLAAEQQILPPGIPGYEELDLYPANVGKAKQLIAEASPSDMEVTVWTDDESPNKEAGEYFEDVLKEIGFDTTLKILSADVYFEKIGNASTPELDAGWANWFSDYPHPNAFFRPLLTDSGIADVGNTNAARFNDPKLTAKVEELGTEQLGPEQEAAYAELDREFMEAAPYAPYGTLTLATFVSSDVDFDELIVNPTFGQVLTSFKLK
jgi:peptide/nickel transport system substrate-binding protein